MASMSGVVLSEPVIAPVSAEAFDATGRRIAIVGGTGGLGRALARLLASKGASVVVVGQTFRDAGVPGITFLEADLSVMAEARRIGRALPAESLDVVVLTTGIVSASKREVTAEGIERDLAISYLSRVAVLEGVVGRLGTERADRTRRPRVFVMGFPGAGNAGDPDDLNSERAYRQMAAHMNTVAGNEALVLELARTHPELGVFGLNPGLIRTGIRANALGGEGSLRFRIVESLIGLVMIGPDTYAQRLAPILLAPELEKHSGLHFNQKGRPIRPSDGMTDAHVAKLMAATDALLARVPRT